MYDMYHYEASSQDNVTDPRANVRTPAQHPRRRARKTHSVLPAVLAVTAGESARSSSPS